MGPDTNGPTVVAVSPVNGAVGVSVGTTVEVTFSEAMDAATITNGTISLSNSSGVVAGTVAYYGSTNTAVLTPGSPLAFSTLYMVVVANGGAGVKDVAGNALTNVFTASFTTQDPDLTRPTVVAVSPVNGAVGVSLGTAVRVTFSEAMDAATITNGAISLSNSSGVVAGTVAYYGSTNTAVLTPGSPLALSTLYTVVVANGGAGVKDVAGNALTNVFTASFTTQDPDLTRPTVVAVSPVNGAVGVSLGTAVRVTFSEAMDAATITNGAISLSNSSGVVAGTVAYYGSTNTAVLTPGSPLALSTLYTVVVANGGAGVKDVAGNALLDVFTASFTTTDQAAYSIWPVSATPSTNSFNDPTAYELGVKFRSDINGYVTGVRFYKGPGNGGTHVGNLWTAGGVNLASATFAGETASGWQQVDFATPVAVSSNTTYVASYFAPQGYYALDTVGQPGGLGAGVDNPPLHALAHSENDPNGVFKQSATSIFPTNGNG
ncbi:MAG: Ig-like domain-containing protein, partial [Gemmatimonadota bacterium]